MAIATNLQTNFNNTINTYGVQYILVQKTATYDNYDQETLTVSGSILGSCYFLPVSEARNGDDFQYLQEGIVQNTDRKLFMPSGVVDENDMFIIQTGSYSVLRWFDYTTEGTVIYKKVYVRTCNL